MGTHPIFESDFDCLTEITQKAQSWENPVEFDVLVRCATVAVSSDGPIWAIKRPIWALPRRPTLSVALLTLKESSSKKSELKPNSPTQPFESASEFSLSKTERKSLLSSQMTVALTTSKKTTRFGSLDSVDPVMLSEIFLVFDSRLLKSLTSRCWPCLLARRKDQDHKRFFLYNVPL